MIEKVYTETTGTGRTAVCLLMPEEMTEAEAHLVALAAPDAGSLEDCLKALSEVVDQSLHPPDMEPAAE